jgi:hypothetical protein
MGAPSNSRSEPEKEGVQAQTLREESEDNEETGAALRSAVEMPGPRKTWKTKLRFPTFPTAPWKSPKARFPHSHRADDDSLFSETQNQDATARALRTLAQHHERRIHPRQRANTVFHSSGACRAWNQTPISGSCPDWKMRLEKNLPEPSPAGYNIMCSGSASYGRF